MSMSSRRYRTYLIALEGSRHKTVGLVSGRDLVSFSEIVCTSSCSEARPTVSFDVTRDGLHSESWLHMNLLNSLGNSAIPMNTDRGRSSGIISVRNTRTIRSTSDGC